MPFLPPTAETNSWRIMPSPPARPRRAPVLVSTKLVILTNAVTRENTTRVEVHIAWLRDFIHLLVVLANPTHDLVPHRDNRAVNNSVNEELNRLRKDLL